MSQEVVLRAPGRCKRDAHFNTAHRRAILESSLISRSSGSCKERTIFPKALENIGKNVNQYVFSTPLTRQKALGAEEGPLPRC